MTANARRNAATFGPGTFGRDMVYTFVSLYLVYYITEIVRPGDSGIWGLTAIMLCARIFDAFVDFFMASVVERTRSRWGQFKPWITAGVILSAIATVLLFNDKPHFDGLAFIISCGLTYLLWGTAWSINDIAYWSLLPALSVESRERELIGSIAKVVGTIGLFTVAIGILPASEALVHRGVHPRMAWFIIAAVLSLVMVLTQMITVFGVRQPEGIAQVQQTSFREITAVLRENDQVLWAGLALLMFMTGFTTTTTFGPYYFKYVWGDEDAYPIFAAIAGVAQLVGYAVYPLAARKLSRRTLYDIACGLIFAGYVVFLFVPHSLVVLGLIGFIIFFGQASVVLISLLMLADTIDYGQWKTGKRHGAITFAIQPFIYKVAAALATAVVGAATVITGISRAATPSDVSDAGRLGVRIGMLVLPLVLMVIAFAVLRRNYRIDEPFHRRMIAELRERGELAPERVG